VKWEVSDTLRYNLPGFPADRALRAATGKTRVRDTLMTNAAKYYGAVATVSPVDTGDVSAEVETIFAQIVPSAQTETPIVDARSNGLSVAYTQSGSPITRSISLAFTTTQALFVGGGILHRLADRDAKTACRVGIARQDLASGFGLPAGARQEPLHGGTLP